jgi:hypothetical protein
VIISALRRCLSDEKQSGQTMGNKNGLIFRRKDSLTDKKAEKNMVQT